MHALQQHEELYSGDVLGTLQRHSQIILPFLKDVETETPRHLPVALQHNRPDHKIVTDSVAHLSVALPGLSPLYIPTAALWGWGTWSPKLQMIEYEPLPYCLH